MEAQLSVLFNWYECPANYHLTVKVSTFLLAENYTVKPKVGKPEMGAEICIFLKKIIKKKLKTALRSWEQGAES